jgi:hypothetical protein
VTFDQGQWESEQDDQERRRDIEERTAEAIDSLYRALRDCLHVAAEPQTLGLAQTLVDGLLMAEHERHKPWRPFPFDRAVGALNMEFLLASAEHFLADIRTAVMLLRSTAPGPGGRRHGVEDGTEDRCVCGWEPTPGAATPITQHLRAVIELGGER